jgi:hypothetical protein
MRLRNSVHAYRTAAGSIAPTDIAARPGADVHRPARHPGAATATDDITPDPLAWAQRVVDELSHDLRQPLTAISMNLQCAMRLLQSPSPRLSPAVEALSDCLSTEAAIVDLVEHAQRRLNALLGDDQTCSLNSLADDIVSTVGAFEPSWADRLVRRLAQPAPLVAASASHVRISLLAMIRRLLLLEEFDPHPLNRLVIETHASAPDAELLVSGIPPSFAIGPLIRPSVELLATAAKRCSGSAILETEEGQACLVVTLPLLGRDSASSRGGADGE